MKRDHELDVLFEKDPDLREFAQFIRTRPHPAATVDPNPHFRVVLKQRLMREAWQMVDQPPASWYRRLLAPPSLAWAGAAVGALLMVFVVFNLALPQSPSRTVVVHSDLDGAVAVSVVKPIPLTFSQPMDTSSVQSAITITPSTKVNYNWNINHTQVTIVPIHPLTPNTQYQLNIAPVAKTESGQPVTAAKPVQFVTVAPAATPTPTPSTRPSGSPAPVTLDGARSVAASGNLPARWSSDGSRLFVVGPNGQLLSWLVQGGTSSSVEPDGVTVVAAGPGGPAYVRGGKIVYGSLTIPNVAPIALGFRSGGGLVYATPTDIWNQQGSIAHFSEEAASADFSPTGDRLVYRTASGTLHLVDLTAHPAKDTSLGGASGLGDWLPADGSRYAYPTDSAVWSVDTASGTTSKLSDLSGVGSISWSRGGQLLLSTSSALYLYTVGDTGGAKKISDGVFGQATWSPAGNGAFAFKREGQAWVAKVVGALSSGGALTSGPALSQDAVVSAFMDARRNGLPDQATSYLDAAGNDAFAPSKLTLVYTDPSLARYYLLLSQPGHVVVRLVLVHGTTQTAVDETLTLTNASGKLLIHNVSEVTRASFGLGPEIVKVVVAPDHVQVLFDSDIDQTTIQGGVSLKGVTTVSSYDATRKAITLSVSGGLTSGTSYDLLLNSSLKDTPNDRLAVPYDLQFVGP